MAETINGLVIKTIPYRDNDRLVTLLTPDSGIQTFLVRGAKKITSHMAADTELLTNGTYLGAYPKNGSLGYINSIDSAVHYTKITQDIEINSYADYIAELLNNALKDTPDTHFYFEQFEAGLALMNRGLDPQLIANVFELQLLVPFGVAPNWQADPIDGQTQGRFDYSEKYNGIIDQSHFDLDEHRLHADPKTVYYLRMFSQLDLRQVNSMNISESTKRGLQRVIDNIYERQVGNHSNAKRFINSLKKVNQLAFKTPIEGTEL